MRRLVSVSSGPSVSELRLWELNLEIMSRDEQYLFHAIFHTYKFAVNLAATHR